MGPLNAASPEGPGWLGPADGPLVVTGASGFLGRAIVAAGLEAGFAVRALVRNPAKLADAGWAGDPRVTVTAADLAGPGAAAALAAVLPGAAAAIHAAAAMGGGDAVQARDTLGPTAALLDALAALPAPPPLVLVGSIAVYNAASLPEGACLDETVPLEPEPALRDAYARARLRQEALAVRAAQRQGLRVRVLRVGAIVGPGRLGTARLGFRLGPLLLMPGGGARVPAIAVADCATVAVRAAAAPPGAPDIPILSGGGHFEAINVLDAGALDQAAHAAAIAASGWPKRVVRLPAGLARAPARAAALAGLVLPGLVRRLPVPLRLESWDARFKPLRYATARLEDRLGWRPARPFAATLAALAAGRAAEDGPAP